MDMEWEYYLRNGISGDLNEYDPLYGVVGG
jgi:hypothetical protein